MTNLTPPVFLTHNGVNVYRTYKQRMAMTYWYTTDPRDWYAESSDWKRENRGKPMPAWLHKSQFDIRDIARDLGVDDDDHESVLRASINAGLLPVTAEVTA